jgi:hypothetical protein
MKVQKEVTVEGMTDTECKVLKNEFAKYDVHKVEIIDFGTFQLEASYDIPDGAITLVVEKANYKLIDIKELGRKYFLGKF